MILLQTILSDFQYHRLLYGSGRNSRFLLLLAKKMFNVMLFILIVKAWRLLRKHFFQRFKLRGKLVEWEILREVKFMKVVKMGWLLFKFHLVQMMRFVSLHIKTHFTTLVCHICSVTNCRSRVSNVEGQLAQEYPHFDSESIYKWICCDSPLPSILE